MYIKAADIQGIVLLNLITLFGTVGLARTCFGGRISSNVAFAATPETVLARGVGWKPNL